MKHVLLVISILSVSIQAVTAQTKLEGTSDELSQFLNGVTKTAVIQGQAKIKAQADNIILHLSVKSEDKLLETAITKNESMRNQLARKLQKVGIEKDKIAMSSFSWVPEEGYWSDKYKLDNIVNVIIDHTNQFQHIAAIVDQYKDIEYRGMSMEHTESETFKLNALTQACKNAQLQKVIYEESLGIKLTPISFSRSEMVHDEIQSASILNYRFAISKDSYEVPQTEMSTDNFGELEYFVTVSIEYRVEPG